MITNTMITPIDLTSLITDLFYFITIYLLHLHWFETYMKINF